MEKNGFPDQFGEFEMRKSKQGKTVYLDVGIWFDENQGHIHMAAKDVHGFHTTVSPYSDSKRGHPNLFMKLAKCLRNAGAPHPEITNIDEE